MWRPYPIVSLLLITFVSVSFTLTTVIANRAQNQNGVLSGTVKDPNGAVVPGAQITARNEASGEVRNATTDGRGNFKIEKLAPGKYTVIVTRNGFKNAESSVTIEGERAGTIEIKLEIAETRAEIGVAAKGTIAPNTDPNYRAMRDSELSESYEVANLMLKRDVGVFTLKQGSVSFLPPVQGRVAIGVFAGEGEFALKPVFDLEANYLKLVTDKDTVNESFERLVFCFTDATYDEIKKQGRPGSVDARAKDALRDYRNRVRRNTETPRSMLESMMTGEDVENVEAKLLADLYNPKRPPSFNAYLFGRKHGDLRFYLRPYGAMPQLLSPEEVALINVDPQGKEEGVWYLSHLESEFRNNTASSEEDKRLIDAEHYKIETAITGEKLTASAELTFKVLRAGERVLSFGLLPTLRVTRVEFGGQEIPFIQEKKNEDSAFYAVLPAPLAQGESQKIKIEYEGQKVLQDAGGGNFAVGARTSWYPSVNAFNDRATYDLTFKVPKKYILVGVGKKAKEWTEGDFAASQWVSDVPLAVAGFNYGQFKKKELMDEATKYGIEGYATSNLPDYLRGAESIGGMSPVRLLDNGLVEAQNSMRIFTHWFGAAPYGRIAITQQPQPFFGQSWPTLVYLPIMSFFDSTQRWRLMGGISTGLTEFIQEVTPHEVAHQWWGHIVGWASYHDQWLSEGFADFSASLYLQATDQKLDKYLNFWKRNQEQILTKNEFGKRANDAGPLWMGLRLNTYKTPGAYGQIVYPKGGYVLHMLRWMMYDRQTGDQRFKTMMQDFVKENFNQNVSTERFKRCVEKHMTPQMDLDGNKRMDWFFREWVYGTEVPRYRLDYTLTPQADGKTLLTATVTQSDVSPNFKMIVPLYLDFDGKIMRLGEAKISGSSTTPEFKVALPQKPKRVLINYYYDVLATESVSNGK
jgi:hypothetical protein